jgi:hypothetical protein
MELSRMPPEERAVAFDLRQTELDDLASGLRGRGRKSWKKPASFALSLAGSALSAVTAPVAAAIRAGSSVIGYDGVNGIQAGAYSYVFKAHSRYGDYW